MLLYNIIPNTVRVQCNRNNIICILLLLWERLEFTVIFTHPESYYNITGVTGESAEDAAAASRTFITQESPTAVPGKGKAYKDCTCVYTNLI